MTNQIGRQGNVGGVEIPRLGKSRRAKAKRDKEQQGHWSSRSGEVVTRLVGETKIDPPPPSRRQQLRQDRWL